MKEDLAKDLLDKTRNDYNLIAEEFSATRWNIWAEFSIFRDYVQDRDRVLDIGCGNGRLLNLISDKKIDYVGVDNSENQIHQAQKKYPGKRFLVSEATELPFEGGSFDKIFLVAVLHNVPSVEFREKVLRQSRGVLADKGLLILTVWDIWRFEALKLLLKHSFLKLIGKSEMDWGDVFVPWADKTNRYYHFFTHRGVLKLVRETGFKVIESGLARNENKQRSNFYIIARKVPIA